MGSEWRELPFTEAVEINPKVKLKKGEIYPFVDMKAVDPAWRSVTESEKRAFTSGGAKFEPFDTLLARITPCLENGKIGRYVASNGANGPAFGSTEFIVIRGKDGVTDNNFAYYLTKWQEFRQFAISQMTGSSGRQRVPAESLGGFTVPVPDIAEQRAIAHILGSLDDKIELNRRMNETLEAMAQALFKSWFIDFDPVIDNALAAGHPIPEELQSRAALRESLGDARKPLPDDLRNLFPGEFEFTEEMGWIPKGWKAVPAENALDINPRVQLKKNTTAPFVDMKALPTSGFSITEVSQKAYSGGAKFNNGDVLLARITPCLENGKTGIVDFLDGDETGFGSTEFIVLRGKGAVTTPYVACLSRLASFRDHCIQSMVGSSGRQRVQNACFSNFYLAVPPNSDLLKNFDLLVRGDFDRITEQTAQNRTLTQLRDNLLPKLLSGEIRIQAAEKLVEVAV